MLASQVDNAPLPKRVSPRKGKKRDRTQALEIQRKLTETILDPKTEPASRASCAAAWARVQEARRILEGKPLPGQLRPDLAQSAGAKRLGPPAKAKVSLFPKPAQPSTLSALQSTGSADPAVAQEQSMPFRPEAQSAGGA